MKKNITILYLYEEVMGYTLSTMEALSKEGAVLHVVHWDHKKITPFQFKNIKGINFYKRSKLNSRSMMQLIEKINPDVTVVSGWNDRLYLWACNFLRKNNGKVILAIDGYWRGGFRQNIAKYLGLIGWFGRYYSHAWVPGLRQFEYVKKLGFRSDQIIFDLYSADLSLFSQSFFDSRAKRKKFPHRFLYVGRFELVKGVKVLLEAWEKVGSARRDWDLHLIGCGSIDVNQAYIPALKVSAFMQPTALVQEVELSGCFILPSLDEPWGVVAHEFSAAGLPLILSNSIGSKDIFMIPGTNGYSFERGDSNDLAKRMLDIIEMQDEELLSMGDSSHLLAQRISPVTSAGNLLSVMYK